MSRSGWLFFVLSIVIGIGLGLFYGWVVSPVEYVDTTPSSLRSDFRTDYVLMVAETFQHDHDIQKATRNLAILGSQPPIEITIEAVNFAQLNNFNNEDITLLQNFSNALKVGQVGTVTP